MMYLYLFTNKNLSPAQVAVQSAHAAQEVGAQFGAPKGCNIVLFGVDIEDFRYIEYVLNNNDIQYTKFYEPDIESYTSIATEPIKRTKLFKKLKLYEYN